MALPIIPTLELAGRASREVAEDLPQLFVPSVGKVRKDEEEGAVAWLFGVPVGFQFGTALGLEGIPAFVVDILTDPTTYLLGGIGGLTKLGKASRAAGRAGRLFGKEGKLIDQIVRENAGKTFQDVVTQYEKSILPASKLETHSFENIAGAIKGETSADRAIGKIRAVVTREAETGWHPDSEDINKLIGVINRRGPQIGERYVAQEIAFRKNLGTQLADLIRAGREGDFRQFRSLSRRLRKLRPSARFQVLLGPQRVNDLKALWELERAGIAVPRLARGPVAQAKASLNGMAMPQRSLVKFSIPGTGIERTLVTGLPVFKGAEKLVSKAPFLGARGVPAGLISGTAEASRRLSKFLQETRPVSGADTVLDVGLANVENLRGLSDESLGGVKDVAYAQIGERQSGKTLSEFLTREIKAAMPDLDDRIEAMAVAMGRKAETAVTAEQAAMARSFRSIFDEAGVTLQGEDVLENLVDNYFTHVVKRIKKPDVWGRHVDRAIGPTSGKLSETFRFGRHRKLLWDDLLDMEHRGVIELEKDPANVLGIYFRSASHAAANTRLTRRAVHTPAHIGGDFTLKSIAVTARHFEDTAKTIKESNEVSETLFESIKGEMADWTHIVRGRGTNRNDDRILDMLAKAPGEESKEFLREAYVHKDFLKLLRNIVDPGLVSLTPQVGEGVGKKIGRGLLWGNSFVKRVQLAASGFHFMALTESSLASVGWPFLKDIGAKLPRELGEAVATKARSPLRGIDRSKLFPSVQKRVEHNDAADLVRVASGGGLNLGELLQADRDVLNAALSTMRGAERVKGLPVIPEAIGKVQRAVGTWDRALWDFYHNGLKMFAWHENYMRGLLRYPGMSRQKIAEAAAAHTNNAFGGQVWEKFWFGSKSGQQALRAIMFAPDWTISNLRIAWDVFANILLRSRAGVEQLVRGGTKIPFERIVAADAQAFYARQYALRASIIAFVGANMANMAFTGHFMDENPEGFKHDIMLPYTDDRGRNKFWRFGKQFREPFDLLENPNRFASYKQGGISRSFVTLVTGRDLWGREIAASDDGPLMRLMKQFGFLAGGFAPFGVQTATGIGGRSEPSSIAEALAGSVGAPIRTEFKRRGKKEQPEVPVELNTPQVIEALNRLRRQQVRPPMIAVPRF